MIFTTIHDIYKTITIEHKNEDGTIIGIEEVEKTIKKNLKTPIYLELEDIRAMMPYYSKSGRMYKRRTMVKTPTDSYILYHTFDELVKIKDNKHKKVIGFR